MLFRSLVGSDDGAALAKVEGVGLALPGVQAPRTVMRPARRRATTTRIAGNRSAGPVRAGNGGPRRPQRRRGPGTGRSPAHQVFDRSSIGCGPDRAMWCGSGPVGREHRREEDEDEEARDQEHRDRSRHDDGEAVEVCTHGHHDATPR